MDDLRLVLASASPARLQTLRAAGLRPEVVVSGVDEESVTESRPAVLAELLARMKRDAVTALVSGPALVIGGDSVLEVDGQAYGKPSDPAVARQRWRALRGRSGVLHSGLAVTRLRAPGQAAPGQAAPGQSARSVSGCASARVWFDDLTDDEVDAYVATGEPLQVAGAFTIDGLGGPFVDRIDGHPSTVVGISLPLLRAQVRELGVSWPSLWGPTASPP